MHISRLIDQPYLDLSENHLPWIRDGFYRNDTPFMEHLIKCTFGFLFGPDADRRRISAIPYEKSWIESNDQFLDLIEPDMVSVENCILREFYRRSLRKMDTPNKIIEFNKLYLPEKLAILKIPYYGNNRNLKRLWQLMEERNPYSHAGRI